MSEAGSKGYYYSANNMNSKCRHIAEKSNWVGIGCSGFKPMYESDIERAAIAFGRVGKCGVGTEYSNGQCIAHHSICGTGTKWDNAQKKCVEQHMPSSYCADGTRWENSKCVPGVPTVACDSGTRLEQNKCVVDCGPGTHWGHKHQMCVLDQVLEKDIEMEKKESV